MNGSRIEWTSKTWNPITGCPGSKVSPGCANCYAERAAKTRLAGRYGYGAGEPFGIHVHEERMLAPLKAKKPQRVFVCSMGDLFHDAVPLLSLARVFVTMALCPQHTFYLLTKRPENMRRFCANVSAKSGEAWNMFAYFMGWNSLKAGAVSWPLPNVWAGVTVCNQAEADAKVPVLLETPAAKRFVSVEPMLGPVFLSVLKYLQSKANGAPKSILLDSLRGLAIGGTPALPPLDWVICGGETGKRARPLHPYWVRTLCGECKDAGVPFFFKSWGEWKDGHEYSDGLLHVTGEYVAADDIGEPWGHTTVQIARVGKRRSGRLLDGREWNEVPV